MRLIGYLISLIGLIIIALTIEPAKKIILNIIPITIPAQVTNIYLTIGGLILIIIGIAIVKSSGGGIVKRGRQGGVPIYDKRNRIVGYRE